MRAGWLVALAACGPENHVAAFDGQAFPIASSFLTVAPDTFGDDDLVVVSLSSVEASCDAERAFRAASATAETPEALAEAWAAAWPPAFTEAQLVVRVQGGTWPPAHGAWSGLAWDALPEENGVVFATFTRHFALRDAAWWTGDAADDAAYEETWLSNGGLVKWGAAEPGVHLSGRLHTGVTDGAGTPVGDTELRFDATICGL